MNILNIEHVSKVFGEKVVLDDVSYGVHQGDKIGIIGINGTGKSTILKIIGGLEEPDEGQVITQNGLRITYLPQMPEFPQGASVLDYVAEGKWQKDWSTESEARNVLNKLGITDHEEKIDHLSGGQKKRVALARTLVMFNPVIISRRGRYETEEGCLSLEGVRKTTRYQEIEVEYYDSSWKKQRQKLSGWTAQIAQHEIDHLSGKII